MLPFEPRLMTWGLLGTLGGVSLVFFACAYLLFSDPESDPVPEEARPDRAAIRLEMEEAARERLGSYGWVDREKGVVRIPVERARELWLKERAGK